MNCPRCNNIWLGACGEVHICQCGMYGLFRGAPYEEKWWYHADDLHCISWSGGSDCALYTWSKTQTGKTYRYLLSLPVKLPFTVDIEKLRKLMLLI